MTKEKDNAKAPAAAATETQSPDLQAQIDAVTAERDKALADLEAKTAEAAKLANEVKEVNEELAKVSTESAKKDKNPTIKVGKETYILRIPKFLFVKNGKNIEVTQKVLEEDPELAAELVKKGSGALVKKGGK